MASQSAAKADIFHVCIIYLKFHFRPAAIDVSNRFPGRMKQIKVTRAKLEHTFVKEFLKNTFLGVASVFFLIRQRSPSSRYKRDHWP